MSAATIRRKDLEILLDRVVPKFPAPRADLEQYRTPAPLAADLMFRAFALGDLAGRSVLDLGCGTGMLAVAAAKLGASVRGFDVDEGALAAARGAAAKAGVEVSFEPWDARTGSPARADVVVSNPPFGAQRPGADRPFLEAAFASAGEVVLVVVNAPSAAFADRFAATRGFARTHAWDYLFEVPHVFAHHARARADVPVVAIRFHKNK